MKGPKNGGIAPFLPGGNRQALAARALDDQGVFVALCTFNPFFQKFQGGGATKPCFNMLFQERYIYIYLIKIYAHARARVCESFFRDFFVHCLKESAFGAQERWPAPKGGRAVYGLV